MPSASPSDRKSDESHDDDHTEYHETAVYLDRSATGRAFCSFEAGFPAIDALDAPDRGGAVEFVEAAVFDALDGVSARGLVVGRDTDDRLARDEPVRVGTLTYTDEAAVSVDLDVDHLVGDSPERHDRRDRDDRDLVTDGGSKYVVETGDGYLGVWAANRYTLEIAIGTFEQYDWRSDDDVVVVDDPDGIALVEAADADPDAVLTDANVVRAGVGTNVVVPTVAAREIPGLDEGGDVRAYERDDGAMLLVAAAEDPRLADAVETTEGSR